MKIQNHPAKILTSVAMLIVPMLLGISISPVFGANQSSSGPYNPVDANPSFQGGACGSTSPACADALSTSPEFIESFANTGTTEKADAWNNENSGHSLHGSAPSLLTSGTRIIFAANLTYTGTIQSKPQGTSNLNFEVDGYDTSFYLGGCQFTVANTQSNENSHVRTNCIFGNNDCCSNSLL